MSRRPMQAVRGTPARSVARLDAMQDMAGGCETETARTYDRRLLEMVRS